MNENRPVTDSELTEWILTRLAEYTDRGDVKFAEGHWCLKPQALKDLVRRMTGWQDDPEGCTHDWKPYGWENEFSKAKGVSCWRCGKEIKEIPLTYLTNTDRIA